MNDFPIRRCPWCSRCPFGDTEIVNGADGKRYASCKPPCEAKKAAFKQAEQATERRNKEQQKVEKAKQNGHGEIEDKDMRIQGSAGSREAESVGRSRGRRR